MSINSIQIRQLTIICANRGTKSSQIIRLQPYKRTEPQELVKISDSSCSVLITYNYCNGSSERITVPHFKLITLGLQWYIAKHKLYQYSKQLGTLINQPFITKNIPWLTVAINIAVIIIVIAFAIYLIWRCRKLPITINLDGTSSTPIVSRLSFSRIIPQLCPQSDWKNKRTNVRKQPYVR